MRNGHVCSLPLKLPDELPLLWEMDLGSPTHAGIAVNAKHCLITGRDPLDQFDHFLSVDPQTGQRQWEIFLPAIGNLDYGNASRSTPFLGEKFAWFQGAYGDCVCVELKTGTIHWQQNVISKYGPDRQLVWGLCSSPLIWKGQLFVNPGGAGSSLVSLNANTGTLNWKTPGNDFGYGSFIIASINKQQQIIGHDKTTLGGWDPATGKRLWSLTPEEKDDFNVPTPLFHRGRLIVATENNGTRVYGFDQQGKIIPEAIATQKELAPETITPVIAADRLLGISNGTLYCLKFPSLKIDWEANEPAFDSHATLITDDKRVLIAANGELFLIDATADYYKRISHQQIFEPGTPLHSHPAIQKNRLFIRGGNLMKCFKLENQHRRN